MKAKKITAVLLAGVMLGTVALSGCGKINPDSTVVTVNDTEVSLGFANFAAKYQQALSDQYYVSYFGEDVWQQESRAEEGETMQDVQKDSVMEQLENWYLLDQNKEDYQVEITEEEQKEITEAAKEFMEANSEDAIDQVGAAQEYVEQLLYFNLLTKKMQEAVGEQAEITVTDEDAAQRTFSYIYFDKPSESDDADSEDTNAEEELKKIQDTAAQAKEDFDAASKAREAEKSSTTGTYSYDKNESAMDENVITAADELKEGEVSDLIETENRYYVIRLDSEYDKEASASNKERLIQEQKDNHYTEVLKELRDSADIKVNNREWKKVEYRDLFEIISDTSADASTDTGAGTSSDTSQNN